MRRPSHAAQVVADGVPVAGEVHSFAGKSVVGDSEGKNGRFAGQPAILDRTAKFILAVHEAMILLAPPYSPPHSA